MSVPYVSTRGYYDLSSGKTLKNITYHFSSKDFGKLERVKEVVIMIHGLRNDRNGAKQKFLLAKRQLQKIGYLYPVIGYSYDSNTKGAHLKKYVKKSLIIGKVIAKKNGRNLGQFILDLKMLNPKIKVRLLGHSLGSEVILATLLYLAQKPLTENIIESVYFFGSSVEKRNLGKQIQKSISKVVSKKLVNYYAYSDQVLADSQLSGLLNNPIGLVGLSVNFKKYKQKMVSPKTHRFANYITTLKNFP